MPAQMLGHERRDEVVTMVVSRLDAERQRDAGLRACSFEKLRPQFLFDERVCITDVDEEFRDSSTAFDERDGVVAGPARAVFAEISRQSLLAPRDLRRRDNG